MIKKIFLLLLGTVLFISLDLFYKNHSLNPHFVDEEDNMVLGKYLLEGDKIYGNLFSHHQPLAYVFSAGIQKITHPGSLFLLVKRHREAVMVWAGLWSLFLIIRFGWPLFLFSLVYEPTKINLFGNLFLSESIVVYPIIYLISRLLLGKKEMFLWEWLLVGLAFSISFLLLSPLWPALIFLAVWFFLKYGLEKNSRSIILFVLGVLIIVALTLPFISLKDYWQEAFYLNFYYYIPGTSKDYLLVTFVKALLSPLAVLMTWDKLTQSLKIIQLASIIFLTTSVILGKKGYSKSVVANFIFLGLMNFRYVQPGTQEYNGFHLLPWYAVIILLSVIGLWNMKAVLKKFPGSFLVVFFTLTLIFFVFQSAQSNLFPKRDMATDYYVNYSRQFDFGEAVRLMKNPDETLMVVPDDWLIYWQADIKHAHKMVNYYAWMSNVPEIKQSLDNLFNQSPPTYFYCDCKFGYFGLENYFYLYRPLERDGQQTKLLVLTSKLKNLTDSQKDKLGYLRFKIN